MNKAEVLLLAQLLTAMKDAALALERSYSKKDMEQVELAKKEMLKLQKKIDQLL